MKDDTFEVFDEQLFEFMCKFMSKKAKDVMGELPQNYHVARNECIRVIKVYEEGAQK